MSKTISVGTIIFVDDKVLLGHVTNAIQWELPKGKIDGDEGHNLYIKTSRRR